MNSPCAPLSYPNGKALLFLNRCIRDNFLYPKFKHLKLTDMPEYKPGLVSITFRKLSPEQIVKEASRLSIEGIEWGGDVHVPHGDTKTAESVGRISREAGLDTFCYGAYYRFREVHPEKKEPGPEIEAVLDSAEALGAPRIRIWAGEMDYEEASMDYVKAVADRAHEVAELAQSRDLAIDLEFHGGTLNNSARNSLQLLELINHPNVSTLWQPAVPLSVKERAEGAKLLLPCISNIHCFHWGPRGWNDRFPLADGEDAWKAYLSVLQQSDKDRWVALEFVKDDSLEQLEKDAVTLQNWLGD